MKTVNKMKEKKRKTLKKPTIKAKKEKVLIVAQEIKFARLLSGNEKKTRDRVLKSFKKWLLSCFQRGHEFKEDDFIRVWKGLFYAVWMSDKPLVQEELCETIAGILDLFPEEQIQSAFLMMKAGFRVLATEWYGIDHHRMDKFLMLVRRYLRGGLRCAARCGWSVAACELFTEALAGSDGILAIDTPVYARNASSMLLHVLDCYIEEIAKVSNGSLSDASTLALLRPLCRQLALGGPALAQGSRRQLTRALRHSAPGLRYRDRTKAWEQMGCPRGGPDALESDDEEEEADGHEEEEEEEELSSDRPLDPRAGRVDVVLSPLVVPPAALAAELRALLAKTTSKAYKRTRICMERFEQLAKDEYPLKVEDVVAEEEPSSTNPTRAARALRALEKKLKAASDELALRGLSRKHRKRLLAKRRAGLSIVEDVPQHHITSTNGDWAVLTTELNKKTEKQTDKASNKENLHKNKQAKLQKQTDVKKDKISKISKNNKKDKNNKKPVQTITKDTVKKVVENGIVKPKQKNEVKVLEKVNKNKEIKQKPQEKKVGKTSPPQKLTEKPKNVQEIRSKSQKSEKNKILNGKVEKKVEKLQMAKNMYSPKKVKFVLKNNSMQGTVDYYKSVRQSPSIPFDSSKRPSKTNLKVSTPSPINPFFKKKLRLK